MIVARFYDNDIPWRTAGGILIEGAVEGANYHCEGWFPVESFNFGIQEKSDGKSDKSKTPVPQGGTAKPVAKPATGVVSEESDDKVAFNKISIKKQVDRATCDLMLLAMVHRSIDAAKGEESKIMADVHVLSSVEIGGDTMYPTLMIHMEGVLLTGWNVDGSGDSRPGESISFKYDQAAMHYLWTKNGKEIGARSIKGWDQKENKPWPQKDEYSFEQYLPRMSR